MRVRRVILFLFVCVFCSCGTHFKNSKNESVVIAPGYYFVIQLESVKSDTIEFKPIEIYSPSPLLKVVPIAKDSTIVNSSGLLLSSFRTGFLKGVRQKDVGSVFIVYTNSDWIAKDNFVKFDWVDRLEWTLLSQMFTIGK